jgi:hypothetical protein
MRTGGIFIALSFVLNFGHSAFGFDAVGEQRTAVVLIDLVNDGTEQPAEEIRQAVLDSAYSIANYVREASYGKTWLNGKMFGWHHVTKPADACDMVKNDDLMFELVAREAKLLEFDRFIVLYNRDREKCKGLGESTHGKVEFRTPQGKIRASVSRVDAAYRITKLKLPFQKLNGITSGALMHELGHGFGNMSHSNLLECGSRVAPEKGKNCSQVAIADVFSLMGGDGFHRPTLHFDACHKEDIGWLSQDQIYTVTSLPASVKLSPYEIAQPGAILAIKVPLKHPLQVENGPELKALYLEYRTPVGFDSRLKMLTEDLSTKYKHILKNSKYYEEGKEIDIDGVQLRGGFFSNGHCNTSYLFDTKPDSIGSELNGRFDSFSLFDSLDSFLVPGESFDEPTNGLHIQVERNVSDGTMQVTLQ